LLTHPLHRWRIQGFIYISSEATFSNHSATLQSLRPCWGVSDQKSGKFDPAVGFLTAKDRTKIRFWVLARQLTTPRDLP